MFSLGVIILFEYLMNENKDSWFFGNIIVKKILLPILTLVMNYGISIAIEKLTDAEHH